MNKMKEKILRESHNYRGSYITEDYVLSNMVKGFVEDYKEFGESTANLYKTMFMLGDDVRMDLLQENIEYITEMVENSKSPFLFESALNNFFSLNEDDSAAAKKYYDKLVSDYMLVAGMSKDQAMSKAADEALKQYPSMAGSSEERAARAKPAEPAEPEIPQSTINQQDDQDMANGEGKYSPAAQEIRKNSGVITKPRLPDPEEDSLPSDAPPATKAMTKAADVSDSTPDAQGYVGKMTGTAPEAAPVSTPKTMEDMDITPNGFKTTPAFERLDPNAPIGQGVTATPNAMVATTNNILAAKTPEAAIAAATTPPAAGALKTAAPGIGGNGILGWIKKAFNTVKGFFTGGVKSIGDAVKSGNWGALLQIPLVKGAMITGGAVLAFKILKKLFGKKIRPEQEASLKAQLARGR